MESIAVEAMWKNGMSIEHVEDLLTTAEAAELLKVSSVTIKRYLKQGLLPAYHVGPRAIRIRKQDLQQIVQPKIAQEVQRKQNGAEARFQRPTAEELQRREAVVARILAKRDTRRIAPMTADELVRLARKDSTWYGGDH